MQYKNGRIVATIADRFTRKASKAMQREMLGGVDAKTMVLARQEAENDMTEDEFMKNLAVLGHIPATNLDRAMEAMMVAMIEEISIDGVTREVSIATLDDLDDEEIVDLQKACQEIRDKGKVSEEEVKKS